MKGIYREKWIINENIGVRIKNRCEDKGIKIKTKILSKEMK